MISLEAPQRKLILALCFGILATQLESRVIAPVLPNMGHDLNASVSQTGWILTAYLIPYGLFQLLYGPISARVGKIRLICLTMAIFSVGTFLNGYWLSLPIVIGLRFVTGAAAAAIFPLSLAYVGDTVPYARRQEVIGLLMTSAGAAGILSASVGGFIASVGTWQHIFPIVGAFGCLATVFLFRSSRYEIRGPGAPLGESFFHAWAAFRTPRVLRILSVVFLEGLFYLGCFPFWSEPLARQFGCGPLAIGLILGTGALTQLLSARFIGSIVRYASEVQVAIIGGLMMSVSFLIVAISSAWWPFVLAAGLAGAGFTLCHSTLQARATEVYPQNRAAALGLFAFSIFLGSGIGSAITGYAIEYFDFHLSMSVLFVALLGFSFYAGSSVGILQKVSRLRVNSDALKHRTVVSHPGDLHSRI